MANVSFTSSAPSDAVTWTLSTPSKSSGGVPVKLRVTASKLSHAGRAVPSDSAAVRVSASPSTSVNEPADKAKFTAAPVANALSASGKLTTGASFTGVIARAKVSFTSSAPSDAVTLTSSTPLKSSGWDACEAAGHGIEAKPRRQCRPIRQYCRQGQHIAIHIRE